MATVLTEKQINAFVKGLITEAGPLTFPDDASLEEENFDLETDGSRSRRLGVDYEIDYTLIDTNISADVLASTKQSCHVWNFPDGSTEVVLGVVRVFNRLYFVNLLKASPSSNLKNGGNYITLSGLDHSEIQTTVINGYFIIVSKELDLPILLTYNKDTDVITQEQVQIFARDLNGVDDQCFYDARPADLTHTHQYNLMNQGWNQKVSTTCYGVPGNDPADIIAGSFWKFIKYRPHVPTGTIGCIECTKSVLGVYPSNADIWTFGKEGSSTDADYERYDPNHLVKNSISSNPSPKGSYILDIFNRGTSRINLSGVPSLLLDQEQGRISTIATYASRIFYSGINSRVHNGDRFSPNYSGYIFFSQTVTNKEKLSNCFQENDPTSPDISDLLDTDGGTIQIPEVSKVVKLVNTRSSLVVFAENGIWEIFGDTKGFVATSYQVSKVSNIGVSNPNAIIDANGIITYWASTGIHALVQEPTTGRLQVQNLSLTTIQTFYDDIPVIAKKFAKGFYDEQHNHLRWMYNDSDTYSETNYPNHYNKELNFDLALKAFYIYSISELDNNSPHISDYIVTPAYSQITGESNIYVESSQVLVGTDPVVISFELANTRDSTYRFLTFKNSSFTISSYRDATFTDWKTSDGIGKDFSSYLVTGYEISGDMLRKKQIPYILFYFKRTENGYSLIGGNLELNNQSGCTVQAQWNWSDSANSGKWSAPFNAYRLLRNYIPSGVNDPFDYGESVIVTKNKFRGSGKAISLKIQSIPGKDMKLLGWAYEISGNSKE